MSVKTLFNEGWLFHRGEIKTGEPTYKGAAYMQAKTESMLIGPAAYAYNDRPNDYRTSACYTDETWEQVDLPHDYVIKRTPDEKYSSANGYLPYENAWYRKHFRLDEEDRNRRIAVRFGSVTIACEVFCNGVPVARSETGNVPFEIDLTDFVWFDRENVLAVHVMAERHEGWWYEGAGICRDVWLIRSDPVFVPTDGICVRYEKTESGEWHVHVVTEVQNDTPENRHVSVRIGVAPAGGGEEILSLSASTDVPSYGLSEVSADGTLGDVRIWDIDDPFLYNVTAVLTEDGNELDRSVCRTGFRTFRTAVDGFYLNGRKVTIYGMNCHEDAGLFGHAIPDNIPAYKLSLLKDMGCNGYRCCHYMQSDAMMDALDEAGFIVIAETRWYNSSPEGLAELEKLIRRDRNRPSVFFWSLGNEEPRHRSENGVRMIRRMRSLTKKLDPTRPVTSAFCAKTEKAPVMAEVDVIGINYNLDDYDACREKYPDVPLMGTETSATSTTRGWYRDFSAERGYYPAYDRDTTENFRSREYTIKYLMGRKDVMGLFQWDGFEHRGESLWPRLCSQAGAIDMFFRRKDAFYQNKTHFTAEDMLHVLPHWNLPFADGTPVKVAAYTTGDAAECLLDGVSYGKISLERYESAVWTVPYKADGTLKVRAFRDGKVICEKEIRRTGTAVALRLSVELPVKEANGRDAAILICEALDSEGRVVPDACPVVSFSANSLGRVVATGSDVCDHVPVSSPLRRMYMGSVSVAVLVGKEPGELRVYAESDGLKGDSASITLG